MWFVPDRALDDPGKRLFGKPGRERSNQPYGSDPRHLRQLQQAEDQEGGMFLFKGKGGGGGGPSSFGGAPSKNVEQLLVQSLAYQNERKNLCWSNEEIQQRAKARAPQLCRVDNITAEIQSLLAEQQGEQLAVKVYLVAPYAKAKVPLAKAIGLRLMDSFGIVHMGLQLGPLRIDWMSDSFVHIKTHKSGAGDGEAFARVVFDPTGKPTFVKHTEQNVMGMAEIISRWNRTSTYHMVTANCQDFIYDLLAALDIAFTPPT
jgi:hypothetical protein